MFFDTHTHLDQPDFDDDRDEVIARAHAAGVSEMIAVGTTADASQICQQLAAREPRIYAAVGIQPNYVAEAHAGDWDRVVQMIDQPHVVALGETGLDRHWDFTPFAQQQDYFDRHLRLSQEQDLPFIVHMRDCDDDILIMLRDAHARGPLQGVLHSFTGSQAMADESVAMGLYVSFAGMVTFKKSDALRAIAASIPDDRILIETDCPYLSPHPVRSQRRNEPANVPLMADCLAQVRGASCVEFARQTTANARRLFRLQSTDGKSS